MALLLACSVTQIKIGGEKSKALFYYNSAWGWATGPDPLDVSSAELLVEAAQMQDFDAIVQGLKRAVLRRMAKVPKPAEETKVSKPIGRVRRIGQVAIIAELTGSKGWFY